MPTLERTLNALANPHRLHIVDLLTEREQSAGELAAAFEVSRPAVSRHLRVLREAGVVRCRPQAQLRVYGLNPEAVDDLSEWANGVRSRWKSRLDRLETHLDRSAHSKEEEHG